LHLLPKEADQVIVKLHRQDTPRPSGEGARQHAGSRSNLKHAVIRTDLGRVEDPVEEACILQEVLPESLARL
jgi:hypothetical protein